MPEPEGIKAEEITSEEQTGLERAREFQNTGAAYAIEHRTRPSTIGLVLASSPIAYLAWSVVKF